MGVRGTNFSIARNRKNYWKGIFGTKVGQIHSVFSSRHKFG